MEILPKVSKGGRKLQNYSLLFFLSSSSEIMVNFVDEKFDRAMNIGWIFCPLSKLLA